VSDDLLARLYSGATAAIVPSLSEGFGLPAVEAAACGAAAVLSDLPPHRETLGDAAVFFQPMDVRALCEAMDQLLGDEALRHAIGARCRQAVAHLSWDTAADQLRELIVEAVAEGGRRRG
jgi:glycosyltransferase involved in cell wall biosynthesis